MTRTLVIVRHGNTFTPGEAPRRIGRRTDLPLVSSGRAQAEALGRWFAGKGWHFDRVLCSPLKRTYETAEAIAALQPSPPSIAPSELLAEIDHGVDEDQPDPVVIARIGAGALAAWDIRGEAPDGWQVDSPARLASWRTLFAEAADETLLLVTSNGAARFALLAHPALAVQAQSLPSLKLRTGAFGVILVGRTGVQLTDWDRRPKP